VEVIFAANLSRSWARGRCWMVFRWEVWVGRVAGWTA